MKLFAVIAATATSKIDAHATKTSAVVQKVVEKAPAFDSCSKVELEALQEKFWPYYQKVKGDDYDAEKSGRIDMEAIAHYKFLHQKCGDQAYMEVDRRADQATSLKATSHNEVKLSQQPISTALLEATSLKATSELYATSKIDAHATKTSAVVQKVVEKAPAFDSCSKVELEALQEKFWPYYQKVNGDYDAEKSGRIDMEAIAHYKFLHQKCGDQAYMEVDRRADQAYMKVDRQCGETSECAFEWKSQRWGKKTWTSHCQAKLDGGYHIDCHTCDWCERKAPDGQIVRDEPRKHFKLCDAQNCANWECKEWCHCFDEKAEHLGLYEHHGCDEDDSSGACECETTGNGATFSGEDQMFLKKRNHELMKKTTKTAWSADMKRLAPRVKTMEIAAKHKFVAAKHK